MKDPRPALNSTLILPLIICFWLIACSLPLASGFLASASGSPPVQHDGFYTGPQAERGRALYDTKCASCHGAQLENGSASALTGSPFAAKWGQGNHSVDDLYYITR